ncbi:uncharacterized protein LOC123892305 [Trifolium pratense]|uniref:Uncharacterized protein n=1 Tax=Trifolium pratense TaxID=57577 RepID=A0ACB0JQ86_TRIPR|nr:uncharacterized protein LOC123892305 [Trifolium pratense]CAJ2645672.1 unnamed protein product [Trifolium pratense]
MSDSAKSSPTKTNDVPSLQQMVIDAIPLNTIPPTSPTMKRKSTAKKVKSSRTSTNSSSPATIKGSKRKSKKAKGESSKSFTMSELHIDPLPSSGAATPVANPTVENVDASGKTSVNISLNIPKSVKTLGVETPDMWKFVYHRRLALERNLKEDILECQSIVEAIEYVASPEYRQVFVRGKCVKFSPTVINQHLQRSSDEVAALKVTDNEVCKVLTGGRIKAKFDYGSYFFQETLSHALTYAVEKPVALPTLLCNIILEQHPDILRSTDVPCKRKGVKQMIADLTEASRALEARKLKIDRVIEALKAEEAAEAAEGEPDGQEGVKTSGSDDSTEDVMEDSDESSSI